MKWFIRSRFCGEYVGSLIKSLFVSRRMGPVMNGKTQRDSKCLSS